MIRRAALIEAVVIVCLLGLGVVQVMSNHGTSADVQRLDSELHDERQRASALENQLRDSHLRLQTSREGAKHSPPKIAVFDVASPSSDGDRDEWTIEWEISDVDRVEVYAGSELLSREASGSVHRAVKAATWVRLVAVAGPYTIDQSRLITPIAPSPTSADTKNDVPKQKSDNHKQRNVDKKKKESQKQNNEDQDR